jgi:hypothetical protein
MNEQAARDVLLVRAVESTDSRQALITDADRQHAARAATELTRWTASERGEEVSAELYLTKRAELLANKLSERERGLRAAVAALGWRPWVGVALPLVALGVGAFLQQVGDRQHINVLAFPLLSIVVWNLLVYLALAVRMVSGAFRSAQPSGLRRAVANLTRHRGSRVRGDAAPAFARFTEEWTRASAPLLLARASRVLHLSAALLAIGAVAGLYVRGLVLEYRAGWESTFLDASQVHAILSTVLGPAAHALGMQFPTVSELESIRLPESPGENAARWIHWYALGVAALVIVPRLLLAAIARWREQRLSRRFPLSLDEPYYRRLLGGFVSQPARLRVIPYSYTADETSARGLATIANGLLGDGATVVLRPVVAFGAEASAADGLDPGDTAVSLTAALFNLAATPEHENHGAFLGVLKKAVGDRIIALVDEAPYGRRLGDQAGARERLVERRNAWAAFCSTHAVTVAFVDLWAPDVARLERDVEPVLAGRPA